MRVQLEKRGVLGAGQVKKGGSLPRHIPILNIYVSTPPRGYAEVEGRWRPSNCLLAMLYRRYMGYAELHRLYHWPNEVNVCCT